MRESAGSLALQKSMGFGSNSIRQSAVRLPPFSTKKCLSTLPMTWIYIDYILYFLYGWLFRIEILSKVISSYWNVNVIRIRCPLVCSAKNVKFLATFVVKLSLCEMTARLFLFIRSQSNESVFNVQMQSLSKFPFHSVRSFFLFSIHYDDVNILLISSSTWLRQFPF